MPEFPAPVMIEYSAAEAAPMAIQGRREVMRIRLELAVLMPPQADPLERVAGGALIPPEVAAELLGLPPGSVLIGPTRTIDLAPRTSGAEATRVEAVSFDGGPPEVILPRTCPWCHGRSNHAEGFDCRAPGSQGRAP